MKSKREKLMCPSCGKGRIIDCYYLVKSELYDMDIVEETNMDFFAKCRKCGKVIGIKKK